MERRSQELIAQTGELEERIRELVGQMTQKKTALWNRQCGSSDLTDEQESLLQAEVDELDSELKDLKRNMRALSEELKQEEDLEELQEEIGRMIAKGRRYLDWGEGLYDENRTLISEFLGSLVDVGIDLYENLRPQLTRLSELRARYLYNDYANLKEAGFSRWQAFILVCLRVVRRGGGVHVPNVPIHKT